MRRYDQGYRAMKQALDDRVIGAPLLAHCVHRNAAVPAAFASDMLLTDSAVHEMDVMRWLLGEEITAVSVVQPRRSGRAPGDLQDPQLLLMQTGSGVHIDVELFVNCGFGYDVRCELVGETGTVSLTNPAPVSVRSAGIIAEPIYADWRDRFAGAYDIELREWVSNAAAGVVAVVLGRLRGRRDRRGRADRTGLRPAGASGYGGPAGLLRPALVANPAARAPRCRSRR